MKNKYCLDDRCVHVKCFKCNEYYLRPTNMYFKYYNLVRDDVEHGIYCCNDCIETIKKKCIRCNTLYYTFNMNKYSSRICGYCSMNIHGIICRSCERTFYPSKCYRGLYPTCSFCKKDNFLGV